MSLYFPLYKLTGESVRENVVIFLNILKKCFSISEYFWKKMGVSPPLQISVIFSGYLFFPPKYLFSSDIIFSCKLINICISENIFFFIQGYLGYFLDIFGINMILKNNILLYSITKWCFIVARDVVIVIKLRLK